MSDFVVSGLVIIWIAFAWFVTHWIAEAVVKRRQRKEQDARLLQQRLAAVARMAQPEDRRQLSDRLRSDMEGRRHPSIRASNHGSATRLTFTPKDAA